VPPHADANVVPPRGSAGGAVPSWSTVFVAISLFVVQYWLSGKLDNALASGTLASTTPLPPPVQQYLPDLLLLSYGLAVWWGFDRTKVGLSMSVLTAICGPAIEVILINLLELYHYSHPQVLGVPTWIPWVYFCGGPAVGLLGRRAWADLLRHVAG
jgi:hypothetical protein